MTSQLIALTPPRESAWTFFGPHEVGPPYPKVLDSNGSHSLGWRFLTTNNVLMVELSLNRVSDNHEIIPFKALTMRAEPTFSLFFQAFNAIKNDTRPFKDAFEFLARDNPELDRTNENMKSENEFLGEVLSQWFVQDHAFQSLVGNLYVALSSDVAMFKSSGADMNPKGP